MSPAETAEITLPFLSSAAFRSAATCTSSSSTCEMGNKSHEERDSGLNNNSEARDFVEGKDGLIVYEPLTNPDVLSAVQKIREQFEAEFQENPDLYISRDLEMIREDDYYIRRFLYPHDLDPEPAYHQFRDWMAWRKESGFEDASDQRFPIEFFQIGALFPYLSDKEGTLLLYMRFKVYRRIDILDQAIKQFVVYNMDLLDSQARKERGWAVVFDTQGAGVAQIDFDMLVFLFKTVKQYYPWGMKYVCVYELPWILHGAWKITQRLLPQDATRLFRFCNRKNITDLIDSHNLPDFMGGQCEKDYRLVPQGCRPAEQVAADEMGLTSEQVKSVKKHFDKHFADSRTSSRAPHASSAS